MIGRLPDETELGRLWVLLDFCPCSRGLGFGIDTDNGKQARATIWVVLRKLITHQRTLPTPHVFICLETGAAESYARWRLGWLDQHPKVTSRAQQQQQ